jgi:perosamine synthetase
MFSEEIKFIKELYGNQEFTPLHEPRFLGHEKEYLNRCIDSTFVSSVGQYVTDFEKMISSYTGIKHAISTVNGTTALHLSLVAVGVKEGDEVLCPALTFVATANAIAHAFATPIFVDASAEQLGMCPVKLEAFLRKNAELDTHGNCVNRTTRKIIRACIPMHVFGHPVEIKKLVAICKEFKVAVVEDAAEALGSTLDGKHVGHDGALSTLSFNGNKIITCGGGGMILTNDDSLAKRLKHLATTAKRPHAYEFFHDEVGYNYRLPNLNAALACAQMEQLDGFLANKRETARQYQSFFEKSGIDTIREPKGAKSNFWLFALLLKNKEERDLFLTSANASGVMSRPIWALMNRLPMFAKCQTTDLDRAIFYEERVVNIPSSVRK